MDFVHVELKKENWFKPYSEINKPEDAVNFIKNVIKDLDKEILIVINLSVKGQVINASICSIGTIDRTITSIVEILKTSIFSGSNRIILIHNHPSGYSKASQDDLILTKRLYNAARLLDIELVDHIIIGSYDMYSIRKYHDECFKGDLIIQLMLN